MRVLIYLALDAFCLIEIFNYIRERMRTLRIEYDFNKALGRKLKTAMTSLVTKTGAASSGEPKLELSDGSIQTESTVTRFY